MIDLWLEFAYRHRFLPILILSVHLLSFIIIFNWKKYFFTSIFLMKWLSAVFYKASLGQGKNQSIVVQFTNPGKVLSLLLKSSPTGENARRRCRFFLHYDTKYKYFSFGEPDASVPTSSIIFIFSSVGKRFGTSPLFKRLQISST